MTYLAIALAAAVGAPLRFAVDRWVTGHTVRSRPAGGFPWGIYTVNVIGSALAGLVLATTSGTVQVFLLVGFCGAFTTFSGFGWDVTRLWPGNRAAAAATLVVMPASCILAFLAVWHLASAAAS